MTKQRGPLLQTQAARTTKKMVLALMALLGVQAAALAATAYDNGWQWNGECWCSHRNDSSDSMVVGTAIAQCIKTKCENAYGNPSQGYSDCMNGGGDQAVAQIQGHSQPNCSATPID